MNNPQRNPERSLPAQATDSLAMAGRVALAALALLAGSTALALPEDEKQPILVEAGHTELYLDQGLVVYRGTDTVPATITQGSLLIAGEEIRIERQNGALRNITATGKPARFQQQPAHDQAVVHASGLTLVFDNVSQRLMISEEAEFIQGGNTLTGYRIDYDVQTRKADASGSPDGRPVQMTIQPQEEARPPAEASPEEAARDTDDSQN